jgi:biotin-(acetyl-CoA carboxylase) ligase
VFESCAGLLQVLLAGILNQLEGLLSILVAQGFQPLLGSYLDAWLHSGQRVRLCHRPSCKLSLFCLGISPELTADAELMACKRPQKHCAGLKSAPISFYIAGCSSGD